jgi:molecular chaperone GrpE
MSDNQEKPVEIDLTPAEDAPPAAKPADTPPADAAPPPSDLPVPAPPTPEERIAALEAEKTELRDRMLRIAADADNYKKRARKEHADGEARARETVLRDLLEVADNLERATASLTEGKETDAKSIRDGVELVLRQFRSKLERYQVKAIESVGQAFDPRLHEAISRMQTADAKPGAIVHELQKGYMIGDKLLRPAMVVVAAPPPAPTPEAAAPTTAIEGDTAPEPPAKPRGEGED